MMSVVTERSVQGYLSITAAISGETSDIFVVKARQRLVTWGYVGYFTNSVCHAGPL